MKRIWLLLIFPLVLCSVETQVSLSATHNLAYLGDRIGVTLLLKADPAVDDMSAELKVDGKVCEMIDSGNVTRRIVPEGIVLEQKFELAFFDLGDFSIGPAKVSVFSGGETLSQIVSNEVPITIKPILEGEESELVEGKAPVYLQGSPLHLLRLIWVPAVLMALMLGLWILLRSNRRKKVVSPVRQSPFKLFESELKRLFEERLFEKGFQVLFFLRLTHVLKKFLHGWHRVDAEEMTTEEIREKLNGLMPNAKAWSALTRVLESADLVKFARYDMQKEEFEIISGNLKEMVRSYGLEEQKKEAAALAQGARCV